MRGGVSFKIDIKSGKVNETINETMFKRSVI